jgi:hypothetical protein
MPVNTGPDINTYGIPEVSLSNTFNAWRDVSNISAYKLNKLKIYEGLSTASIDSTTTVAGVLTPVLLPTVLSGHTFAGGIAGTTATFSGLLRANSGISCDGGMTVSGDLAVQGGDITTSSTVASLFNTTATNLSIGGAATGITIGSSSANSVTTIQSATTYFSGNLVIGGTATSINTDNLFIEDTVITLGVCGGVGVTTDVSRDRGVEFYWYESGQYATLGFFGFDRSTENFIFYSKGVTSSSGIYSGVTGTFQGNFLGGGITATNLYVSSLGTFLGGITTSGVTATNLYVSSLGTFIGGITTSGVTATNLYVSSLGTFIGGITTSGVTATNLYVSSLGTFIGGVTTSGVTATILNVSSLAKFGGGATFAGGGVTLDSTSPLNVLGVSNYTGLGTFVGGITTSGVTATNLYVSSLGTFIDGITTSGVTATTLNVLGASNHTGLARFSGGATFAGGGVTLESTSALAIKSSIKFLSGTNANSVGFQAPSANPSSSVTWILPNASATINGQVLSSDISNNLTWSSITLTPPSSGIGAAGNNQIQYSNGTGFSGDAGLLYSGVGGLTLSKNLTVTALARFGGGATFAGGGVTLDSTSPLNVLGVSNYTGLGTFIGGITTSGVTATNLYVSSLGTFIGGITTSGVTATTLNISSLAKIGGTLTVNAAIGIGTSTPLAALDVLGPTVTSNAYMNHYTDLVAGPIQPGATTEGRTGACQIILPYGLTAAAAGGTNTQNNVMLKIKIMGHQYKNSPSTSGASWEVIIHGYFSTTFGEWSGDSSSVVEIRGNAPFSRVRLANKTNASTTHPGRAVIILGDDTTGWHVAGVGTRVQVTDVWTHYGNSTNWANGWVIEPGLTTEAYISANYVAAMTVTPKIYQYMDMDGNLGLGTTGPTVKLDVVGGIKASTTLNVSGLATFLGGITASGVTATNLNVLNTTTLKDLFVSGNLTFGGTAATINVQSTNVNVADTIMVLGSSGGVGITGDITNDRGIAFFWNANVSAGSCLGFFGFDRTTQNFVFYTSGATTGTGSSGGVTGTFEGNFLGATAAFTNVRFHDADRTHSVGFRAPDNVASNITWILPGVTGAAGTVIGTDANQNLSWILPAVVAGSDKQVMFNDAGSLAGNAGFVYNKNTFTIGVSAGIGFGTGWGATLSVDTTGLSGGVSISTKGSTAMYWGATGSVGLVGIGGSTASTPSIVPTSTGRLEVNGDIRVAKNGFFVNPNMIITGNCVIGADENAIFAGVLTIASGQTLSVGLSGSLIIL